MCQMRCTITWSPQQLAPSWDKLAVVLEKKNLKIYWMILSWRTACGGGDEEWGGVRAVTVVGARRRRRVRSEGSDSGRDEKEEEC